MSLDGRDCQNIFTRESIPQQTRVLLNEMTFFSGGAINYLIKTPIVGMLWLGFFWLFLCLTSKKVFLKRKLRKKNLTDGSRIVNRAEALK
jgi:hypothetical protein